MRSGEVTETAHEIRRCVKRLRAVLVLFREPLGKKQYRVEDAELRKVGQALSAKRDAEVLRKTLSRLQQRYFPGKPSPLIRTLHEALVAQERRCLAQLKRSNAVAASSASLKEMLASLARWQAHARLNRAPGHLGQKQRRCHWTGRRT